MGSERKLSYQLMDDIWDKEQEMNQQYHVKTKRVELILIHPDFFNELAREKDTIEKDIGYRLLFYNKDGVSFRGIPMTETLDVEKWELRG
ncbi:MAG: hypothetical protein Q8911_01350 [Bacillota bacterium]|nr:hypothetical protein [Bacillota bacterium]